MNNDLSDKSGFQLTDEGITSDEGYVVHTLDREFLSYQAGDKKLTLNYFIDMATEKMVILFDPQIPEEERPELARRLTAAYAFTHTEVECRSSGKTSSEALDVPAQWPHSELYSQIGSLYLIRGLSVKDVQSVVEQLHQGLSCLSPEQQEPVLRQTLQGLQP